MSLKIGKDHTVNDLCVDPTEFIDTKAVFRSAFLTEAEFHFRNASSIKIYFKFDILLQLQFQELQYKSIRSKYFYTSARPGASTG